MNYAVHVADAEGNEFYFGPYFTLSAAEHAIKTVVGRIQRKEGEDQAWLNSSTEGGTNSGFHLTVAEIPDELRGPSGLIKFIEG